MIKCEMKLFIHSQISSVLMMKIGMEKQLHPNLYGMDLCIPAEIKVDPCYGLTRMVAHAFDI